MRFHSNWRFVKLFGSITVLLLSLIFISVLFSPAKPVGAVMSPCIDTGPPPSNEGPSLVPLPDGPLIASINITPAGGSYDSLTIKLFKDDDDTKPIQTEHTCLAKYTNAVQAVFLKVGVGKYKVCYQENTCSELVEKTVASDTATVSLDIDSSIAPSVGDSVFVQVNIKSSKTAAEDTTYGPKTVTLTLLKVGGNTDLTGDTGSVTVYKDRTIDTHVEAQFVNVPPGLVKACIDIKGTALCNGTEKEAGKNMTIMIDVPEAQLKDLVFSSSSSGNTCGSIVTGLGWIMCPILNTLTGFNDLMWKLVQSLLVTSPLQSSGPVYNAWNTIRGLANVVFVIFFLVIIFSQLTGAGITNYGVKKLLPRLIICAILVNASYIILQLSADLANIIGKGLYDLIMGMAPAVPVTWEKFVDGIISTGAAASTTAIVGGVAWAIAGGSTALMWLIMSGAAMAALGFFAAVLTLAFRQAVIPILAILAPFAFVAYLLPNTEKWFKKWLDLLLPMLMLYPLAALVFAGAQFSSQLLYAQGGWWFHLIGMVVLALPLFSLPFLARNGGSILSSVGGALNKIAEKARAPLTDYGRERSEAAKYNYLADDKPESEMTRGEKFRRNAVNKMGLGGLSRGLRTTTRAVHRAKQERSWRTEANKSAFQAQVASNNVNGLFGRPRDGKSAFDRANAAKQNMGIEQQMSDRRVLEDNPIVNEGYGGKKLNDKKYDSELAFDKATGKNTERLQKLRSFDARRAATEKAKGRAETATADASTRTEQSDGMMQVRSDSKKAAESLENAQSHTTAVIETASTDIDPTNPNITPIELEALGEINAATRTGLIANKAERKIEASATGQAVAAQNQEIADLYLRPDPTTGGVNPYVIRAAGKGGEVGQQRVMAGATSEVAQFRQANVTAAATLYRAQGYQTGDDLTKTDSEILQVAMGHDPRTGLPPTSEQQEAAMEMIHSTTSIKGMAQLFDYVARMPTATPEQEQEKLKLQQALNRLYTSNKPKSVGGLGMGLLGAGQLEPIVTIPGYINAPRFTPFQNQVLNAIKSGKFAAETFISTDKDELEYMVGVLSAPAAISAGIAALPSGERAAAQVEWDAGRRKLGEETTKALSDKLVRNSIKPEQKDRMDKILKALGLPAVP